MAWRDSTTEAHVFIETTPDWSQDVSVTQKWLTEITAAHSGAEQRARRREKALWEIFYQTEWQALPFAVLRAKLLDELQAPVVVPIWTRSESLSSIVSNVATLGAASLSGSPFKVGSYAYFVESGKTSCFRSITVVGSTSITLASGNAAYPDITPPTYTTACRVYPCILGSKEEDGSDVFMTRHDASKLLYHVNEL